MNKKAQGLSISTLIIFALAALVLVLIGMWLVKSFGGGGAAIESLGVTADSNCKAKSPLEEPWIDIDEDKRHDRLCDNCVCKTGCHNDNDDSDFDKLPDICDSVDNDKTKHEFDKTTCPQDKLTYLGPAWGYRCTPS